MRDDRISQSHQRSHPILDLPSIIHSTNRGFNLIHLWSCWWLVFARCRGEFWVLFNNFSPCWVVWAGREFSDAVDAFIYGVASCDDIWRPLGAKPL